MYKDCIDKLVHHDRKNQKSQYAGEHTRDVEGR